MPRVAAGSNMSIRQLEQLLHGRRAALRKLESQRAQVARRLAVLDRRIQSLGGASAGGAGPGRRARNEKSLPDMIDAVLSRNGKPMRVRDIAAAVRNAGYRSNSPQFPSIVNQALIKDKRFASVERGVYQLKK